MVPRDLWERGSLREVVRNTGKVSGRSHGGWRRESRPEMVSKSTHRKTSEVHRRRGSSTVAGDPRSASADLPRRSSTRTKRQHRISTIRCSFACQRASRGRVDARDARSGKDARMVEDGSQVAYRTKRIARRSSRSDIAAGRGIFFVGSTSRCFPGPNVIGPISVNLGRGTFGAGS
jgi:hypothetical protein